MAWHASRTRPSCRLVDAGREMPQFLTPIFYFFSFKRKKKKKQNYADYARQLYGMSGAYFDFKTICLLGPPSAHLALGNGGNGGS